MNTKHPITVHMMVKNEDQWVRYSLLSILPYVDVILVHDTGSTDHTIDAIRSLASPKIKLTRSRVHTPHDVTRIREAQLKATKTDWFWVVDGDEIYSKKTAKEVVSAIMTNQYEGIVVRRYDLLGDLYHRQVESVGSYQLFNQTGHLVTRALNKKLIKGIHYQGDYPNEGFFDGIGKSTRDRDPDKWYITKNYLYHAMYLKRSSLGYKISMFNRAKYKIENGIKIDSNPPEVFSAYPPLIWEENALKPRSLQYNITAGLITPLKQLKRKVISKI